MRQDIYNTHVGCHVKRRELADVGTAAEYGRRNSLGSILAPRDNPGYRARPTPSLSCS